MKLLWFTNNILTEDFYREIFEDDHGPTSAPAPEPELDLKPGKLQLGSNDHAMHFSDPKVKFKSIRAHSESANAVFHAVTHDNRQYMVKPYSGSGDWHEPEHWLARNTLTSKIFDSMGKSHMGVESFQATVPGKDRMSKGRILEPDEDDSPEKRRLMHATHVGQPALVTRYADDTVPVTHLTHDQLAKIDGHHRLAGVIHHVLMSNADGHHRNVLFDTKRNHPVHIDDDVSLSSKHQAGFNSDDYVDHDGTHKNPNRLKAIMSVYGHGEDLDYRRGKVTHADGTQQELGEVGTNYPPEVLHTLHLASKGLLGDGLSGDDHAHLMENARELLENGLEATLKNRHVIPTYIQQDKILRDGDFKTPAAR